MDERCPFIDHIPIKDCDFLYSYVKVPEGIIPLIVVDWVNLAVFLFTTIFPNKLPIKS